MRNAILAALTLITLVACDTVAAPTPVAAPPGGLKLVLRTAARGFVNPVALMHAPGDPPRRLYVVEQGGTIRRLEDGRIGTALLNVSDRITTGGERGLLGLAFHPKFTKNRRFFVNYTNLKGDTRIVEYVAPPAGAQADPDSGKEILALPQPYSNHNGGHLVFAPDGTLVVGTGDGGSGGDPQGNAQNDASRLGKLLSIDVDAKEPIVRIAAKGLRNPWRYQFDAATHDLYIADVGQNLWEWVHVVPGGKFEGLNFGWNIQEGNHCYKEPCKRDGLVAPVAEYSHAEGCSITGGFVYRGKAIPKLAGAYFYADFCNAFLRSFRYAGGKATEPFDWTQGVRGDEALVSPSSFGVDGDGELYVVSLAGTVFRLEARKE